jgi:protein tyrosine phosphatase (PTP) superfamily phosphohydrolase (DUF442 family)
MNMPTELTTSISETKAFVEHGNHPRNLPRPRRGVAFIAVVLIVLAYLWYTGVVGGNVHTVVPGCYYRCAQLTGSNLDSVLNQDRIRTVINLRGGTMRSAWYRSEIMSCKTHNAAHVDVSLSSNFYPPPQRMQSLLSTFDHAAYPVLVHCKGGSDRTGLATTIYLVVYRKAPLDQAETSQLTWRYGHISWGPAHAMNDFFALYRRTNGGLSLRDWITMRYPALYDKLPNAEKGLRSV